MSSPKNKLVSIFNVPFSYRSRYGILYFYKCGNISSPIQSSREHSFYAKESKRKRWNLKWNYLTHEKMKTLWQIVLIVFVLDFVKNLNCTWLAFYIAMSRRSIMNCDCLNFLDIILSFEMATLEWTFLINSNENS